MRLRFDDMPRDVVGAARAEHVSNTVRDIEHFQSNGVSRLRSGGAQILPPETSFR